MPPFAGQTMKPAVRLPRDPAGCWEWLLVIDAAGHAVKTVNGRVVTARRWMWESLFGPIGAGLVVTTTCGSKSCVNPHHLKCCTQAEANRDAPTVTLTPADVREIRLAKKNRMPGTAYLLGQRFGVSPQTIRGIWRCEAWGTPKPNNGPRHKRQATA